MIASGTRLGPYVIAAPIGAGGMGEVYKASDTRLDRTVAIKVLPEHVAADPELTQRFEREAKTLAALSHPHICNIHDVGGQDGIDFLVMEYLEGETLEQRLKKGSLPLDHALQIGIEIADALAAAHRAGIIHRDLKPGNIMLTKSGAKLLDFGLAKAGAPAMAGSLSMLPTTPPGLTVQGTILGTFQYMAPEQLEGQEADARTDIFAFGAVLYEMLTGRKAFEGKSQASLIGAILHTDPAPVSSLQPMSTPPLDRAVKKCLAKNPDTRWQSAYDLLDELKWTADAGSQGGVVASRAFAERGTDWRRALVLAATLIVGGAIAGAAVWWITRPGPARVVRTQIIAAGNAALSANPNDQNLAITPDGSRVIYRGNNQLVVRALDELEPIALSGLGEAPRTPFVSPDGKWVGFFDVTVLKKVAITGGPAVTITPIDSPGQRGATWGPDGTIVFATSVASTGLQRVSADGGKPVVLTTPDSDGDHLWPEFLPGGEAVLFTIVPRTGVEEARVAVFDLRTGTSKVLLRGGSHAHYVSTGHLVYGVDGTLRAVPFDLERLEVTGTPIPVVKGVVTTDVGRADFAVAANGSLAYISGTGGDGQRTVVSVDRDGRASALPGIPVDTFRDVSVSPDGTRLALGARNDVWTYDFDRGTLSRLTTHAAQDNAPLWTADGKRIVFTSFRAGYPEIFWRSSDGTANEVRLLTRGKDVIDVYATGWSPDGMRFLFSELIPSQNLQCSILQATADGSEPTVLVKNEFCNGGAVVSPDGRWIAYHATLSGQSEIYVERYPQLGSRQQISTSGGQLPLWSHDGRSLFFRTLNNRQVLSVRVQSGPTFMAGQPEVRLDLPMSPPQGGSRPYDVGPDGRFFIIRNAETQGANEAPAIVLVLNWLDELKRLVPTN